ncbi:MAG: hypothetical protein QOF60_3396 [Actinomycetota bacterium]|jgi:PAS domain S-box-containing protein|nr:hypothetical protein [Actinomycetota bacterium]
MHRVVLIDDVAEIRLILRLLLEQSGWFEVVGQAADGIEGLAVVASTKPDLVILDVEMPGPDGWTVLPRIKEAAPDTVVVVFSGTVTDAPTVPNDPRNLAAAVLKKGIATGDLIAHLLAAVSHPRDKPPPRGGAPRSANVGAPENMAPWPWSAENSGGLDPAEWTAGLVGLVDASPDAIIGTTAEGRIVSWNPASERIFGYTAEEALGQLAADLVPSDRADEPTRIRERFAAGATIQHVETMARRKDGTRVEIAITVSPVRGPDGTITGLVSIARDITVRREADAALARAVAQLEHQNRELRRSNEDLDNFASVASHDLAQPLQVAFGYLEMLQSDFGATLDPKAAAWLDQSVKSLDRMRRLVQDILQYARTGSSKDAAPGPVDLAEVTDDVIANLAESIEARAARIDVTIAPERSTVDGHQGMLTLLLQNLIGNAVKFVPANDTPHVTVTVKADDAGHGGTLITVADNGPGVPPGQRERVFDMFQRNHGAEVGGSGLGLAICKKIVHRHRGRIWVEDGPNGRGASFCVQLP